MEIRYHGHSCFELSEGETTLIVDPFLAPNNPIADVTADDGIRHTVWLINDADTVSRITAVVDGRIDFRIEGEYDAAPLLLEVAL